MKNLFSIGDYKFIEKISEIERSISGINSIISNTHLEELNKFANMLNQSLAINPPIISNSEVIGRIFEPFQTYQYRCKLYFSGSLG